MELKYPTSSSRMNPEGNPGEQSSFSGSRRPPPEQEPLEMSSERWHHTKYQQKKQTEKQRNTICVA
eukprot:5318148-Pyramimonas_sp.AAC.1